MDKFNRDPFIEYISSMSNKEINAIIEEKSKKIKQVDLVCFLNKNKK